MKILLQQIREKAGVTQLQLAELSGVPQQTISSIESGARNDPRLSTLKGLATALSCDINDLYEDDEKSVNVDAFQGEEI